MRIRNSKSCKLPINTTSCKSVFQHLQTDTKQFCGLRKIQATQFNFDQRLSRQQKACSKPIRLVFLEFVVFADKHHTFRGDLHVMCAVTSNPVREFVRQIAGLPAWGVGGVQDHHGLAAHYQGDGRPATGCDSVVAQQHVDEIWGDAGNVMGRAYLDAKMRRQFSGVQGIGRFEPEFRPLFSGVFLTPGFEASFKHVLSSEFFFNHGSLCEKNHFAQCLGRVLLDGGSLLEVNLRSGGRRRRAVLNTKIDRRVISQPSADFAEGLQVRDFAVLYPGQGGWADPNFFCRFPDSSPCAMLLNPLSQCFDIRIDGQVFLQ